MNKKLLISSLCIHFLFSYTMDNDLSLEATESTSLQANTVLSDTLSAIEVNLSSLNDEIEALIVIKTLPTQEAQERFKNAYTLSLRLMRKLKERCNDLLNSSRKYNRMPIRVRLVPPSGCISSTTVNVSALEDRVKEIIKELDQKEQQLKQVYTTLRIQYQITEDSCCWVC
jgi:hypothetical protein